jgi:ribonuclease T2
MAAAAGLLPAPALAQAWQCRVPPQVSVPPLPLPDAPANRARPVRYTLAISWSPEFCRTRKQATNHAAQCSGAMGRFGFILHGLWPEGEREAPRWCPTRLAPDARTLRQNLCTTPSADLLVHEWAKHGTCMARTPDGYFAAGRALFGSIAFPDMARLSRQDNLTAGAVRDALIERNPSLTRRMIRLKLSETGWLQEVMLCYGADFMPRTCPRGEGGPADSVPVKIWRSF